MRCEAVEPPGGFFLSFLLSLQALVSLFAAGGQLCCALGAVRTWVFTLAGKSVDSDLSLLP